MSYHNKIVQKDLEEIVASSSYLNALMGKSVLVTGATGMLATYIIYTLCHLNRIRGFNIKIIALARSEAKMKERFGEMVDNILYQDVCDDISYVNEKIDYIFHLASSATPHAIVNNPIDIIRSNTIGTINIFELARKSGAKVLFASTREVYGAVSPEIKSIEEETMGVLDSMDIRSSYPMSKRMAETICSSYGVEYGVSFVIARIAHVYGALMNINNDGRVMADFISDAVNGRDIALNSSGEAIRSFCYVTDAVRALFLMLLAGDDNAVYNLSNEREPLSILDLARVVVKTREELNLGVTYREISDSERRGYVKFERVELDTSKLEGLGWKPVVGLCDGISRVVKSFID